MTPRIRLVPYKEGGKVDGAYLYQIWLVRGKDTHFLGFATRTRNVWGTRRHVWELVFSDPCRPKLIHRTAPRLNTVRIIVAATLNIYLAEFVQAARAAIKRREET